MKKIIVVLVVLMSLSSCKSTKETTSSDIGNKLIFQEVPCTCAGIDAKEILKSELEQGMVVSVLVQGNDVLIAPPVDVNAESAVRDGGLVRSFDINGENAIEFPTGSHFLIIGTEYNSGTFCPSSIIAQIETASGSKIALKFSLSQGGYFLPVLDVENGNYVQERGLFRATDQLMSQKVWIRNYRFRLDKLYVAQESTDDRSVEKTKGYNKPTTTKKL